MEPYKKNTAGRPHRWLVATKSEPGQYAGILTRVWPAQCLNPGCQARTCFPVSPFEVRGKVSKEARPCPWRPSPVSKEEVSMARKELVEKQKYYQEHQAEIINDLGELGARKCAEKWNIPTSTWYGLRKRWGLPAAGALLSSPTASQAAPGQDRQPADRDPVKAPDLVSRARVLAMIEAVASVMAGRYPDVEVGLRTAARLVGAA